MASKDTNQVLYEELKCRICESGPKAEKFEWYQCLSHHRICQDCKTGDTKELNKCPCGRFISAEHSPIMEEMLKLETTRFKCKNTKGGCREFLEKEAMISHEQECMYRLVNCPDLICDSKVPFHQLIQHMKTKKHFYESHALAINDSKQLIVEIAESHYDKEEFSTIPDIIECDENILC